MRDVLLTMWAGLGALGTVVLLAAPVVAAIASGMAAMEPEYFSRRAVIAARVYLAIVALAVIYGLGYLARHGGN